MQTPPPYAPQVSPYPAAPSAGRPKLSAAAVCALVASVVALVPVGVVLGIVALFRTRRLGLRGNRLAVVALSLCAVWTALGMVAIIATAAVIGSQQGPLSSFGTGTCFNYRDGADTAQGIEVLSCTRPHDGQIVANHGLGSSYPGQGAASQQSVIGCMADAAHAIPDVGRLDPSTELRIYYPTQATWDAGTRSATCVLTHLDHSTMSGDALDGTGLTSQQRQVLQLTNESVLIRLKLHAEPGNGWKVAAVLERQLETVDRAESGALSALADNPPLGASPELPAVLRRLSAEDATEASQAATSATALTSTDAWQSMIDIGKQAYAPAAAAYQDLRTQLSLPAAGM